MHEIIDAVVDAGRIMLESGSEIYRSEETMVRLAKSFGIKDIDIFTLATCIYVTCDIDGDSYTRIRRIYPKSTDLSKISRINQLSRDMATSPIEVSLFKEYLKEIDRHEKPKKIIVALSMAVSCSVFAFMLQKCNLKDFICTGVISFAAYYLLDYLNRFSLHLLFKNLLVTMFMTLAAILCVTLGLGSVADDIIIGGIMLVVPGVAMTNAIRDTLNGDILSGTIRLIEALTIAIGITLGAGLILYFYRMSGGVL